MIKTSPDESETRIFREEIKVSLRQSFEDF